MYTSFKMVDHSDVCTMYLIVIMRDRREADIYECEVFTKSGCPLPCVPWAAICRGDIYYHIYYHIYCTITHFLRHFTRDAAHIRPHKTSDFRENMKVN